MIKQIAAELSITLKQAEAVVRLMDEGGTVPFIARYRKEATGGLDETVLIAIRDRLEQLKDLEKRRETVLSTIGEQEKLTPELEKKIRSVGTMAELEDLYLPYRPKRRTRGMIAAEKGLSPLAEAILADEADAVGSASKYVNPEKGVETIEDALQGARDIIAEKIAEDPSLRKELRRFFFRFGNVSSKKGKKWEPAGKYKDYADYSERASKAPSHRVLAVLRGSEEGELSVHFLPAGDDEEKGVEISVRYALDKLAGKKIGVRENREQIRQAAGDGYKRLIAPSLETELKNSCKERADREAIDVFASNVRELLMAPPMGRKRTMGVDPGLRTGCKVVVLNEQGDLLCNETIYPLPPRNKEEEAREIIRRLAAEYNIEAVAVGNGTGGRETLRFFEEIDFDGDVTVQMVNESGASVYSASETAREEFPEHDVTVRGAVSIGRRLMDPLSELVKIDPKSIGVGQYQHDVDQKQLKLRLDDVVTSCVNQVGVELNSASKELLRYVSGLSGKTAAAIVARRSEKGPFSKRSDLSKVAGVGAKTFEQAAGFLRITGGPNPLDGSGVHPERYPVVEGMAKNLGLTAAELVGHPDVVKKIDLERYVSDDIGLPTLQDIISELAKPGRDPRKQFEVFRFDETVKEIEDLREGMALPGIVTNVAAFGAFVDVGVHQDGLVHISEMADRFVKDPGEIVKVGDKVTVKVISVEVERKRIGLSLKGAS